MYGFDFILLMFLSYLLNVNWDIGEISKGDLFTIIIKIGVDFCFF